MTSHMLGQRLLLGAYLFVCAAYFMPGASWNPASRFALTRAVVEQGSFEITRFAESTGDRAQVGDRFYSDKAPVPSLLAVPAYAVFHAIAHARHKLPAFEALGTPERPAERVRVSPAYRMGLYVCSISTAAVSGALLGIALFELLRRRVSERAAMSGAIASVLGTPLFVYASSFFGHTIAAAFLLGALALTSVQRVTRARTALAGACLALAAGSEYIASVPALLLAGYIVWRAAAHERIKTSGWLLLGAALPLAIIAGYHQICFGAPWRTGYAFVTRPIFAQGHSHGVLGITYPKLEALIGLLVGRARGLFYLSPLAAVGVAALGVSAYRKRNCEIMLCGAVFVALLLVNASYYMWHGGWATGPRHLVPALGFVGIGIGLAFEQPRWKWIAAIFAMVSVWLMVMTTAVAIEAPPQSDAIYEYLIPALRAGKIARTSGASNLGIWLGLGARSSVVPITLWIAAGAWWLIARCAGHPQAAMYSKSDVVSADNRIP